MKKKNHSRGKTQVSSHHDKGGTSTRDHQPPDASTNPESETQRNSTHGDHNQARAEPLSNKVMAWGTVVLGTAAVIGLGLNYWSISITEQTLKQSQRSNEIAQKTLVVSQSPDMYLTKTILRPLVVGQPVSVEVIYKNFGKTAARRLGFGAVIEIRSDNPPTLNANPDRRAGDLSPETEANPQLFNSPFLLTAEDLAAIRKRDKTVYFYGAFIYMNPLVGENVQEVKVFCNLYEGTQIMALGPCGSTPEFSIGGKKLDRTTGIQRIAK